MWRTTIQAQDKTTLVQTQKNLLGHFHTNPKGLINSTTMFNDMDLNPNFSVWSFFYYLNWANVSSNKYLTRFKVLPSHQVTNGYFTGYSRSSIATVTFFWFPHTLHSDPIYSPNQRFIKHTFHFQTSQTLFNICLVLV